MTPDEKQRQLEERNAAICKYYLDGHKLVEVSRHFRLQRQSVLYILRRAGVWKPYVKSKRTAQISVVLTEETKTALNEIAEREGSSISRLSSKALDEYVAADKKEDGDVSEEAR